MPDGHYRWKTRQDWKTAGCNQGTGGLFVVREVSVGPHRGPGLFHQVRGRLARQAVTQNRAGILKGRGIGIRARLLRPQGPEGLGVPGMLCYN